MTPATRYARSRDVGIAYQVFGEGETDLVVAFPFISNIELLWEGEFCFIGTVPEFLASVDPKVVEFRKGLAREGGQ